MSRTRLTQPRDLARRSDADRIRQSDFDRIGFRGAGGHRHDPIVRDLTFKWATKGGGNGDLAGAARRLGHGDQAHRDIERLVAALALIGGGESIGRDADSPKLVDPARLQRAVAAAFVEHKPDIGNVIAIGQSGAHVHSIGHLRNLARVDEARHFDPPRAGIDDPPDQRELVLGGYRTRLVLQPVTRADLDNLNHLQGYSGAWLICIHNLLQRAGQGSRHQFVFVACIERCCCA